MVPAWWNILPVEIRALYLPSWLWITFHIIPYIFLPPYVDGKCLFIWSTLLYNILIKFFAFYSFVWCQCFPGFCFFSNALFPNSTFRSVFRRAILDHFLKRATLEQYLAKQIGLYVDVIVSIQKQLETRSSRILPHLFILDQQKGRHFFLHCQKFFAKNASKKLVLIWAWPWLCYKLTKEVILKEFVHKP